MDNAEVHIEDFTLFRTDRRFRSRGGVEAYLRSELMCKLVASYSNGVCETVLMKCKKLDTIIITVYRPPDKRDKEWMEAVSHLYETIDEIQAHGGYSITIISGDFKHTCMKKLR